MTDESKINEVEKLLGPIGTEPKFDWKDEEAVKRIFAAHGMTKEEMISLVKDLDNKHARSIDYYMRPRLEMIEKQNQSKDVLDNIMKTIEKDADKLFVRIAKKPSVWATLSLKLQNFYYFLRVRFTFLFTGRTPVLKCTDECFCERHEKEMKVIFEKFKKSR